MAAAFLIGLLLVGLAAAGLILIPPARVGAAASIIRIGAALLMIAAGAFLESEGLTLPALGLVAAGGFVLLRQRLKARAARAQANAAQGGRRGGSDGTMSADEAYAVLGLSHGASDEDIRRAYHDLMQKIHPDHGGTSYLASKINLARDTLLGSSRRG